MIGENVKKWWKVAAAMVTLEHEKFPSIKKRSPVPELSSNQNFHLDFSVE